MIGINISIMKLFKPTTLYIKTHNITGLKYFGKTTGDPFKYRGSGRYWLLHLRKHGNNVTTEIMGYFLDKNLCEEFALKFSKDNNIVSSVNAHGKKVWANQIPENGLDGGATRFGPHSDITKEKIGQSQVGKIISEDTKEKIKQARRHQKKVRKKGEWKFPEHSKQKLRDANLGKTRSKESVEKQKRSSIGKKRTGQALENIRNGNLEYWKKIASLSQEEKDKLAKERSDRAIQAKIDHPVDEGQKEKIRIARSMQENVFPLGDYIKGKVIVVDKFGNRTTIPKEIYYSQTGPKESWYWVSHKSKEAKPRKHQSTR
jgi:hypothetical protein